MSDRETVLAKARATLNKNLIRTSAGELCVAGGTQFKTLWVRDFCHSARGLIKLSHGDVVERQLNLIMKYRNAEGFLPRGLDVMDPKLRVLSSVFAHIDPEYGDKALKPEFLGENRTVAFDSNLLVIDVASEMDFEKERLRALLSPYKVSSDGLLHQPGFSDWQDSARREGAVLLTQLLYLNALVKLEMHASADELRARILQNFYHSANGLFVEQIGSAQYALDSHAFILRRQNLLPAVNYEALYKKLKLSELWISSLIPGVPVFPAHESSDVSWTTKLVGLRGYHDDYIWGWLAAEAYMVARKMQDFDEASRILSFFSRMSDKDPFLAEIYDRNGKGRARTLVYQSEMPFSWTAAKWIEALA
jgi:hypothetical protein